MPSANTKRLLVEGDEEKRVIPYFMDEHTVWGNNKDQWAVHIDEFDGVENLLKPGAIEAYLKEPGLRAIGVIVDADDFLSARWLRIRERCRRVAAAFPDELPADGLIYIAPNGLRIGVWIMPDNQSRGMLETFLGHLLVPERLPLWSFANDASRQARAYGASYTDAHEDKARIHTYLSWLNPPGRQLHVSVLARALDARLPLGERFVRWFMALFELPRRPTPLPPT